MAESLYNKVLYKIRKAKRGSLFFVENFASIGGTNKAINKALERLVLSGELYRVAAGIYVRPVIDKHIGVVLPSVDEIAVAIAKRDKARIVPTGSFALYKLGLTTQVPLNIVYYTDTSPREIKLGNQKITLKKASAKMLSANGEISKLAIQALRSIGKDKVNEDEIKTIRELLKNETDYNLKNDRLVAPDWIRNLIFNQPESHE